MPSTLISALGNTKLILEFLDFFNGGDRFSYSEEATALRKNLGKEQIEEIHLICTGRAMLDYPALKQDVCNDYPDVKLVPHVLGCDDIETVEDEKQMKDTVYRVVRDLVGEHERVIMSSGGRKTLTNRLIEAGILYGCMGYLAITAPYHKPKQGDIRKRTREFNVLWIPARRFYAERQQNDIREGVGDNFRSLYILPQSVLHKLQHEKIGVDAGRLKKELDWLRRLPKADLHCHLGGAFDPSLLKMLAGSMVEECGLDVEAEAVRLQVEQKIGKSLTELNSDSLRVLKPEAVHCLHNLGLLFEGIKVSQGIPALVSALTEAQIRNLCFDGREISKCRDMALEWYMACGDLGGSALLQTETCLRKAIRWLMQESFADGVRYLEVRCSPDNYCRQGLSIRQVLDILLDEGTQFMKVHDGFMVNLLIMATRHKSSEAMSSHVSAAVRYAAATHEAEFRQARIVGFDLAGQEKDYDPIQFQDLFMPLHHHFINITIHAGEMEEDDKIWQALYLLHAKRIGHGLKLINNPRMMDYIRDYGTAIEMCPSSNLQTNSFQEQGKRTTGEIYPLKDYLKHGIAVTLNTDNLGISDTRLSREYLLAARLSSDGLSRWQILKLVKNSFRTAFLPKDVKDRLLKDMDAFIFGLIIDDYFPPEQQ